MTRRTRIALTLAVVVAGLAASGAGIGLVVADASSSTASTPKPNAIECANIDRAYNSWANGRLRDMYAYEGATEVDVRAEVDDQKELLEAVSGYPGQPARELAAAVARFGSELAVLNAEQTITGSISIDQAAIVANEQKKLRAAYAKWKAATCG